MKAAFSILPLFLFFSFAFTLRSESVKNPKHYEKKENHIELPCYFYKRFEGTINKNLKIVMNLKRRDSLLTGNYYYKRYGKPIFFSLNSRIDKKGNILIEEGSGYDNDYNIKITGRFKGKFISPNEIKGEWENGNRSKNFSFDIVEKYPEGSAKFVYKNIFKKREQGKTSKGTASIHINLPKMVRFYNKETEKEINDYIKTSLLYKTFSQDQGKFINFDSLVTDFFQRYRNDIKESEKYKMQRDIYYGNYYLVDILHNSDNLLTLKTTVSVFEGGAHPSSNFAFANFDLNTGRKIRLSDIFQGNYMARLNKLGEKKFRERFKLSQDKKLDKEGFFFDKGIFKLNNNFKLNGSAITFLFNPYEVTAYAYGAPEIVIPYSEIKDIIKPNSIIAKYLH